MSSEQVQHHSLPANAKGWFPGAVGRCLHKISCKYDGVLAHMYNSMLIMHLKQQQIVCDHACWPGPASARYRCCQGWDLQQMLRLPSLGRVGFTTADMTLMTHDPDT